MSLLGSSGRPMVAIGGQHAWKSFTKGDICISLQWLMVGQNQEITPCMCIYPANNPLMMNVGAYVVPQGNAYQYADSITGGPTMYFIREAKDAVEWIGLFADKFTVKRMMDAMVDAIPDLLQMPDYPEEAMEKELFAKPKLGIEVTAKRKGAIILEDLA